ncbi:hypothetical protein S40285_02197 [Stachybotrys chlorohalonatus IBT 40285]|uniref:Ras-GEF domain-containing protein n=1 Tax=Stachybotrys chlorohalonatus (strain IBT 40285) TaxID=1283841 RepID=A0A084QB28_STAC4|nr:hypothetical protein S40285_02197 [Stachybotrys chlorohalonata IBT 40285]
MPLDHAGSHQARSASDDSWPLPSPAAPSDPTPTNQRASAYALNTALTNFSSPTRSRSRSSTATSLNPSSRPGSGIAISDYRDVLTPIPDDPFSRRRDHSNDRYADAEPEVSDDSSITEPVDAGNDNDKTRTRLPIRRDSLRAVPSYYWSGNTPAMENYYIAVIGATGVGKSSFVQRVLGLPRPPFTNATSVRLAIDNTSHMITLLELDLEYFELNPNQPVQWPKQINGHIVPRVDAALVLYDVMNQGSIRDLPQAAAALKNSNLPAVLVACKCERPVDQWEVDADGMANHRYFEACIAAYKISTDDQETSRVCLQTIVHAAVAHRKEEDFEPILRKRAHSSVRGELAEAASGQSSGDATTDPSIFRGFPDAPLTNIARARAPREAAMSYQPSTASPYPSYYEEQQASQKSYNTMLRSSGVPVAISNPSGLFDVDESDTDSYRDSVDIPILQRTDDNSTEKQAKVVGVSFDELVDRLLALRLSKADNNFSDIFLCLYRKFAAPGQLFSAILTRLDRVRDDKAAHYLSKTATQLRIIEVVAKWVSLYPGDFARPVTRRNLEDFIRHLSTEPIFAIAAQHMRRNLHLNVVEDDDTGWANSDESGDRLASELLSKDVNELADGVSTIQFEDEDSSRPSGSSDTSTLDRGGSVGSQFQFHSFEEYDREAAMLEPTDHLPMNKFRYHHFMEIPDDDIADELTRIDWIMFSSIRIRDFVRHVSLSATEKDRCKSLKNVNRLISHFNHIAKWVANLILLRDKAKHRAQMLEKFMNIALKLRQLNNYNGLAAVLAGINGTAIHRLAQTRSLVPVEVQKRFARLVILMGTQKSHFAYRLAWENSPLPRIPFIPLHRRDLVSAEQGSKTFVGEGLDRINWKKFEILGEALLPIMRSQGAAYPNLAKHDTARELVLDCRMPTDDEEIYQRSMQVESASSGPVESTKKKFPWFAK